MEIETKYGKMPIDRLVHYYEVYRASEDRKYEKRMAYLQTPEGKQRNRVHVKSYYEKNKEQILAKAKERYRLKNNTNVENEIS